MSLLEEIRSTLDAAGIRHALIGACARWERRHPCRLTLSVTTAAGARCTEPQPRSHVTPSSLRPSY